jgi:hypothetical protein
MIYSEMNDRKSGERKSPEGQRLSREAREGRVITTAFCDRHEADRVRDPRGSGARSIPELLFWLENSPIVY